MHVDGLTSASGARIVLIDPNGSTTNLSLRFKFKASNNEAKFEALLTELRLMKWHGGRPESQQRLTAGDQPNC